MRARTEGPGAVYLDWNASAPLDPRVAEVMVSALSKVGNAASAHAYGGQQAGLVDHARAQVGGRPSGVVFAASATEANNLAVCGAAYRAGHERHRILVSAVEHASVHKAAEWLHAHGMVRADIIPATKGGFVTPGAVARLLGPDVLLVSVMAANGETGVLNPIEEIAELTRANGSLYHCDATQFAGRMPLAMEDTGIDLVSLSAHKLGGPMGVGALIGTRRALARLEVTVIFVGHSKDEPGIARTRRLFSTLNRYAKPVSKSDIIALDEDDAAAIVTRRLFDSHPLFVNRLSLGKTKAIPVRDLSSVTSIVALYDSMKMVLECSAVWDPKHLRFRPRDETLNVLTEYCVGYWMAVVHETEVLQAYLRAPANGNAAGPYRGSHGGHLFFRPVGILAYTWVATKLCKEEGLDLRTAVERLTAVPMELDARPWAGLLWDAENRRMRTAPEAQRVARWIMYYGAGGTLERVGSSETEVKAELAGLLNKDPEDVELLSRSGRRVARRVTDRSGPRDVK